MVSAEIAWAVAHITEARTGMAGMKKFPKPFLGLPGSAFALLRPWTGRATRLARRLDVHSDCGRATFHVATFASDWGSSHCQPVRRSLGEGGEAVPRRPCSFPGAADALVCRVQVQI